MLGHSKQKNKFKRSYQVILHQMYTDCIVYSLLLLFDGNMLNLCGFNFIYGNSLIKSFKHMLIFRSMRNT